MISRPHLLLFGFLLLSLGCFEACAAPAISDSLCEASQTTYFSCQTTRHRIISLCGALPSALQYRYGKPGKIELAYPDDMAQGASRFASAHYSRYQTERVEISFHRADVDYTVFDYREEGRRSAGVQVATLAGRNAEVRCVDGIRGALAPLARSLHCDTDSALNGGRCP